MATVRGTRDPGASNPQTQGIGKDAVQDSVTLACSHSLEQKASVQVKVIWRHRDAQVIHAPFSGIY